MDDHERRIQALEQARKELEESFLVMTHLETKQSNVIKQQSQAVDNLRSLAEEHRLRLEADEEREREFRREIDRRIADLVSAIGKLIATVRPAQINTVSAYELLAVYRAAGSCARP